MKNTVVRKFAVIIIKEEIDLLTSCIHKEIGVIQLDLITLISISSFNTKLIPHTKLVTILSMARKTL